MAETFTVSRKEASVMMGVSLRTIDRYIKSDRLTSFHENGRIWLSKKEISGFISKKSTVFSNVDNMSTVDVEKTPFVDNFIDGVDTIDSVSRHDSFNKKSEEKSIYKKLYEDAKDELKIKQDRLEIANYKVGQLEAQLKSSIPMLEYRKELYEKNQEKIELKEKVEQQLSVLQKMMVDLKSQKFSKRIFIIILLIILALQPLWLLLSID